MILLKFLTLQNCNMDYILLKDKPTETKDTEGSKFDHYPFCPPLNNNTT